MSATAAPAPAQAPEVDAVPAKPKHVIGQLTTGELARERSRLEAALTRPFSEDVKALLQGRLDAVMAEQMERSRKRQADTAAAKAALAAESADRAAGTAREGGGEPTSCPL
jgi:hypothetical protein